MLVFDYRCVCRKRFDLQADLDRHQAQCKVFQERKSQGDQSQQPPSPTNHDRIKANDKAMETHQLPNPSVAKQVREHSKPVRLTGSMALSPLPQEESLAVGVASAVSRHPSSCGDSTHSSPRVQSPELSAGILNHQVVSSQNVHFAAKPLDPSQEKRLAEAQSIINPSLQASTSSALSSDVPRVLFRDDSKPSLFSQDLLSPPDLGFGQSQPMFSATTEGALFDNGIPSQSLIPSNASSIPIQDGDVNSQPVFSSGIATSPSFVGGTGSHLFGSDSTSPMLADNQTASLFESSQVPLSLSSHSLDFSRYSSMPSTGHVGLASTTRSQALSPIANTIENFGAPSTMESQNFLGIQAIAASIGDPSTRPQENLGDVSASTLGIIQPNSNLSLISLQPSLSSLAAIDPVMSLQHHSPIGDSPIPSSNRLMERALDFNRNRSFSSQNRAQHMSNSALVAAAMPTSNSRVDMNVSRHTSPILGIPISDASSPAVGSPHIGIQTQSTMSAQMMPPLHEVAFGVSQPGSSMDLSQSVNAGMVPPPNVVRPSTSPSSNSQTPLMSNESMSLTRSDASQMHMSISTSSSLVSNSYNSSMLPINDAPQVGYQPAAGAASHTRMAPSQPPTVTPLNVVVQPGSESQVPLDVSANAHVLNSAGTYQTPTDMTNNAMMQSGPSIMQNGAPDGISHNLSPAPNDFLPGEASRLGCINHVPKNYQPTSPKEPPKRSSVSFAPIDVSVMPLTDSTSSASPKRSRDGVTFITNDTFQKPTAAPSGRSSLTNGIPKRDSRDTPKSIVRQNSMSVISNASSTGAAPASNFPEIGKLPSADRMDSVFSNEDMSSFIRHRSDSNISMSRNSLSQRSISLEGDKVSAPCWVLLFMLYVLVECFVDCLDDTPVCVRRRRHTKLLLSSSVGLQHH